MIKVYKSYDRAIISDENKMTYQVVDAKKVDEILNGRKHIMAYRETLYQAIDNLISMGYRKEDGYV